MADNAEGLVTNLAAKDAATGNNQVGLRLCVTQWRLNHSHQIRICMRGVWYEIGLKILVPISFHTFVFALLDAVLLRRTVCSLQMRNVLKTSE